LTSGYTGRGGGMGLYKRGSIWWANLTYNGKQYRFSLKTKNKSCNQSLISYPNLDISGLLVYILYYGDEVISMG